MRRAVQRIVITEHGLSRSSPQTVLPFGNMQTEPTARPIEAEDWAALASVSRPGEREVEVGELAIVTGPFSARARVHPVAHHVSLTARHNLSRFRHPAPESEACAEHAAAADGSD